MGKTVKKYYTGYEKENEIQIIKMKNENEELKVRIWEGFFNNILYSIIPEKETYKGLAYYYYLCDGWYKKSPWKIQELNDVLNELKGIKTDNLKEKEVSLLRDVIDVIKSAIKEEKDIFIVYYRK